MFAALDEPSTADMAIFTDVAESQANVGEHSSAVGERLTALGERRVDSIPRIATGVESLTALGETLTCAGQRTIDRGFSFTDIGENANAVASPPFARGAGWSNCGPRMIAAEAKNDHVAARTLDAARNRGGG